jgi:hypothetical protein
MSKAKRKTTTPIYNRPLTARQRRQIANRVMAVASFRNEMRARNAERQQLERLHRPARRIGREIGNLFMLTVLVAVLAGVVVMQAMAGGAP